MNINQKQDCLTAIDEILAIDVRKQIIADHPKENDLSKIILDDYNAVDFLNLLERAMTQLREELNTGLGLLLPYTENYQNDYGHVNLEYELGQLKAYLISDMYSSAETTLEKLIHYQIKNGFWERFRAPLTLESNEIKKQYKLIEANREALDFNMKRFEVLENTLNEKNLEITTFVENQKGELEKLIHLLQEANQQVSQMKDLSNKATKMNKSIAQIDKTVQEKLTSIEVFINNYQISYAEIEDAWSKIKKEFHETLDMTQNNFEQSKKHIEFTESRREQIELLTGMAADSALGTRFHQREKSLKSEITFWKWAIPVMTVLSVAWVGIVFTFLSAKFDNPWAELGVNLLKTVPAFILLGFVFRQYSKERNLEEEYAFKSSVAMTLTAYSNMLLDKDLENNKSRQEMLLRSIKQLYQQPRIHHERKGTLFSFNTKHLRETVEDLRASVDGIKGE